MPESKSSKLKKKWPWDWEKDGLSDKVLMMIIENLYFYAKDIAYWHPSEPDWHHWFGGLKVYCRVSRDYFITAVKQSPDSFKEEISGIAKEAFELINMLMKWANTKYSIACCTPQQRKDVRYDIPYSDDELANKWETAIAKLRLCLAQRTEHLEKSKTKRGRRGESQKKRFEHWKAPGDACFLIEDNRIKFHYNGEIKDLRLKSESNTHKLLGWLQCGPSASQIINEKFCSKGTRPSDLVAYANKLLNDKIRAFGIVGVPENIEFIRYIKLRNEYESSLTIYPSRDEFDRDEIKQPLFDDRELKNLDAAEKTD